MESVETLDSDHNVPEGRGGASSMRNRSTLCRTCHEAKHGHGIAPTIEIESTGQMTDYEFSLFKQLMTQIIPALARGLGIELRPVFDIDDRNAWHFPMGDVRQCDRSETLRSDPEYESLQAADFW
jgi:hypothetical protein